MTHAEKVAAVRALVAEHQDNLAALGEANVPPGYVELFRSALSKAVSDQVSKVFFPPRQGNTQFLAAARVMKGKDRGGTPAKKVTGGRK